MGAPGLRDARAMAGLAAGALGCGNIAHLAGAGLARHLPFRERDARREIAAQLDDAVPPGFGRGDLVPVFLRPEHAARDAGLRANPPLTVDDGRFQL